MRGEPVQIPWSWEDWMQGLRGERLGLCGEQQRAPPQTQAGLGSTLGSSILGLTSTWEVLFQHLLVILLSSPWR